MQHWILIVDEFMLITAGHAGGAWSALRAEVLLRCAATRREVRVLRPDARYAALRCARYVCLSARHCVRALRRSGARSFPRLRASLYARCVGRRCGCWRRCRYACCRDGRRLSGLGFRCCFSIAGCFALANRLPVIDQAFENAGWASVIM